MRLQPRTCDVELPSQARKTLNSLALHRNLFVAIVSGRRRRYLQETVAVEGVQYFGLHGGERYGKPFSLHKDTLRALHQAKHRVQSQLEDLRGVFVEDKGIGFAVHYRRARPVTVQAANKVLVNILAPLRDTLRVINGELVWEILPTEIPGKGPTVQMLLAKLPAGTLAVCLGNDDTDEAAFRALADQITVRVGERCLEQTRSFISAIRPKCGGSYRVSKRSYLESEYSFQICHRFIPGSHREPEERSLPNCKQDSRNAATARFFIIQSKAWGVTISSPKVSPMILRSGFSVLQPPDTRRAARLAGHSRLRLVAALRGDLRRIVGDYCRAEPRKLSKPLRIVFLRRNDRGTDPPADAADPRRVRDTPRTCPTLRSNSISSLRVCGYTCGEMISRIGCPGAKPEGAGAKGKPNRHIHQHTGQRPLQNDLID